MVQSPHFVDVSGSPRERGRQQGEALRSSIADHVLRWQEHIGRETGLRLDVFIENHLSATDYLGAAETHVPELVAELRGLAGGSNLTFAQAFSLQLMDEEWLFVESLRGQHHCSSLAIADPSRRTAFAAQNMDLPSWMNGSQTIVRHFDPATDRETLVLTSAGMIGLTGITAGLAVVVNTLSDLPSARDGLPVAFVTRGLLGCGSVAEARSFLQNIRHAAGQNYILCDVNLAQDFECDALGVRPFVPAGACGASVWHTNYALAGSDRDPGNDLAATGGTENSRARMTTLDQAFVASNGALDLGSAQAVLVNRDNEIYPVNRPFATEDQGHGFTFASVVWELSPELRGHVIPGPREAGEFQVYDFRPPTKAPPAESGASFPSPRRKSA